MKRARSLLIAATLGGALLTACAPSTATAVATQERPPTPTPPPASPTAEPSIPAQASPRLRGRVHVWLSWGPKELTALNQVVQAFRAENPGVEVSVSYFPPDELQTAFESAPSGSIVAPVLLGPAAWGPELYARGLIQEVDDLVDPELRQAIYPIAWGQVRIEGALVGLPVKLQGVVLFRNSKLASEPAATLEDLIAAAQTPSPQGAGNLGAGLDFGFLYSASHLAACGGALFGPEGEPSFGGPVGLCWLGMLTEFSRAGPVTFNTDQDLELFESGQVAWLMETTARADRLGQSVGESNLVVDPWPIYAATGNQMAGFVWTENAYLSAALDSEDLEVAWAFARFVVSPEAQGILSEALGLGHVPVLQSLEVDQPSLSQARATLSRGVPMPLTQDLTPIAEALEWAARVVAVQGGDPAVAMEGVLGLLGGDLAAPTPEG